ncbi:blue light receptor [Rhizoclosmatium sp. JEL0117]|nr:blue light receptor [Rhizoclosmatium sp. JEL0117]
MSESSHAKEPGPGTERIQQLSEMASASTSAVAVAVAENGNTEAALPFAALVATDANLSFVLAPASVSDCGAPGALLSCVHQNDVFALVKELAQFLTAAKSGARESLAGCAVRCRFSLNASRNNCKVRPFIPLSVMPLPTENDIKWIDVEIGFNIVSRDCLLIFVHAPNHTVLERSPAFSPKDLAALRDLMQKQSSAQLPIFSKPNLFLTIVDPITQDIIYTSSPSKLSALRQFESTSTTTTPSSSTTSTTSSATTAPNGFNHIDFAKNYLNADALVCYDEEMGKLNNITVPLSNSFQMFTLNHRSNNNSNYESLECESLFIKFRSMLFVMTRFPLSQPSSSPVPSSRSFDRVGSNSQISTSASLSPPISEGTRESPVPGKRTFRPWEVDEDSKRAQQIPSISSILPQHHFDRYASSLAPVVVRSHELPPSKQHRTMTASNLHQSHTAEDPLSPLLAAVRSVSSQSPSPQSLSQQGYRPPSQHNHHPGQTSSSPVTYKLPLQHQQQQQQLHHNPHYYSQPTPYGTPHQPSPLRVQVHAPPTSQNRPPYSQQSHNAQIPVVHSHLYPQQTPPSSSTSISPPFTSPAPNNSTPPASTASQQPQPQPQSTDDAATADDDGPKSRPLKPGHCKKCGITASREWRKGPHGLKTLCNACGLRYKRKPWDIGLPENTVAMTTSSRVDEEVYGSEQQQQHEAQYQQPLSYAQPQA